MKVALQIIGGGCLAVFAAVWVVFAALISIGSTRPDKPASTPVRMHANRILRIEGGVRVWDCFGCLGDRTPEAYCVICEGRREVRDDQLFRPVQLVPDSEPEGL